MAELSTPLPSKPTTKELRSEQGSVPMETIFAQLNQQRLAAIKALWVTGVRCVLLLPLALAPLAAFGFLMTNPAQGSQRDTWVQQGRALIEPVDMPVLLGCILWLFLGLYLLGRHFRNSGRQPGWDYVRNYKSRVLAAVCSTHFPGLAFDAKGYIGYDEFDGYRLFKYTSDEYLSDDYFRGRVGNTDVHFAEVVAKRERKYWNDGRRHTTMELFFRGIVFVAEFHKHFHSTTRLIPRGEKPPKVSGQKPVTMEDPEYEALFATTSTDQVDVRYVLSTSMALRFVKLHRRFPGLRALFDEDKVTLTLPTRQDMFEPSLYRNAALSAQIDQFVRDIGAVLEIIEALDLDMRIWSKR